MICSRTVFRCFKALERFGDKITGAAGPYFVGLAVILISIGTVCFFDVIMPGLSYPWLTGPICVVIALNLHMHYFYVCTVQPGFADEPPKEPGTSFLWAKQSSATNAPKRPLTAGVTWTNDSIRITKAATTRCKRCTQIKPERTHHCRVCNRCVLKFDHHCPVRINQCVGIHNERHFVLFMAYLVLSTFCLSISGYPHAVNALGLTFKPWTHHVPELAFIMTYILSVVLCLAVGIMCSYHLWTISCGETSVESQDHEVYSRVAKSRGEDFVNSYDLGHRMNLALFFNIGQNGYPFYTLLLPLRVPPYTDGRSWARRAGLEHHHGVRRGEELTDDDDD